MIIDYNIYDLQEYIKEKERKNNCKFYSSKKSYYTSQFSWDVIYEDYLFYNQSQIEVLDSKAKRKVIEELLTPTISIGLCEDRYGYNCRPIPLTMKSLVKWQLAKRQISQDRCMLTGFKLEDFIKDNNEFSDDDTLSLSQNKKLKLGYDHFIPLFTGHVGTVLGNYYPVLQLHNEKKHKRNPFDWYERKLYDNGLHLFPQNITDKLFALKKQGLGIPEDYWVRLLMFNAKCFGLTLDEYRHFVYWCFDNQRDLKDIINDDDKSSLELFHERKKFYTKNVYPNSYISNQVRCFTKEYYDKISQRIERGISKI